MKAATLPLARPETSRVTLPVTFSATPVAIALSLSFTVMPEKLTVRLISFSPGTSNSPSPPSLYHTQMPMITSPSRMATYWSLASFLMALARLSMKAFLLLRLLYCTKTASSEAVKRPSLPRMILPLVVLSVPTP